MATVKLLHSRVCQVGDEMVSQRPGDLVEVSDAEAERMIASGAATDPEADADDEAGDEQPSRAKPRKPAPRRKR